MEGLEAEKRRREGGEKGERWSYIRSYTQGRPILPGNK